MKSKIKNSRSNYIMESMGLRVVSMFVQEFFYWGWQQYSQENDDGIDGEIILRGKNGGDLGCRIFVQIKCGPGYYKKKDDKNIYIQPYANKQKLNNRLLSYSKQVQPVILVYINPFMRRNKSDYEITNTCNKYHPVGWWTRLDTIGKSQTVYIPLSKKQTWGEHSKGPLLSLVKDLINNWNNHPQIEANRTEMILFRSLKLKEEAAAFYKSLKTEKVVAVGFPSAPTIFFTRIGWRHITKGKRGKQRICNSLKLLPIALAIIKNPDVHPILLKERYYNFCKSCVRFYGLRCRVLINNETLKVQVVLRKWENMGQKREQIWFYSVHIIK